MTVLAFDVTAARCSAAVLGPSDDVLAHDSRDAERGHSELLMPMLRGVLAAARLRAAELDLIAVTTGPGTFTGIRVGLAAARGLALAASVRLCGITSFAAIAAAVPPQDRAGRPLIVAIDSRRGDAFVEAFGPDPRTPASVSPDALAAWAPPGPLLVAGDAAAVAAAGLQAAGVEAILAGPPSPPDAVWVARAALAARRAGEALPPAPFYLRAPAVTPAPR